MTKVISFASLFTLLSVCLCLSRAFCLSVLPPPYPRASLSHSACLSIHAPRLLPFYCHPFAFSAIPTIPNGYGFLAAASITYLPCRLPNEVHELLSWYSNGKSLGVVIPAHLTKDLVPAELGPCHLVQVYSLQDGCLLREHTLPVTTSSQAPSDAYRCVAFEQLNNLVWAWTPSSPESFQGWENLGFSSFEGLMPPSVPPPLLSFSTCCLPVTRSLLGSTMKCTGKTASCLLFGGT